MTTVSVNPLNVLALRELDSPPELFHYVLLDANISKIPEIRIWIYESLKYRFYIGITLILENNYYVCKTRAGFEDAKESSFFLLTCPFLTK